MYISSREILVVKLNLAVNSKWCGWNNWFFQKKSAECSVHLYSSPWLMTHSLRNKNVPAPFVVEGPLVSEHPYNSGNKISMLWKYKKVSRFKGAARTWWLGSNGCFGFGLVPKLDEFYWKSIFWPMNIESQIVLVSFCPHEPLCDVLLQLFWPNFQWPF